VSIRGLLIYKGIYIYYFGILGEILSSLSWRISRNY